MFGFDAPRLRLLSAVFASITLICYTKVLEREVVAKRALSLAVIVVAINPYFVGVSVFVFTDMLALLGMVVVWSGVQNGRAFATVTGLAVATLTRQYSAFLAAAIVIYVTLANGEPMRTRARLFLAALTGMIPLGVLIVFWGWSLSPDTYLRDRYLSDGVRFDPHALSLYMAAPGVYLLPLATITLRRAAWTAWLTGTVVAMWVVVFPVRASAAQLGDGIATVGFAHRAFVAAGGDALAYVAFVVATVVGVASMATWFTAERAQWWDRRNAIRLFPWVALLCFLALLPFSFQPWEKYALPELVICAGLFARYYDVLNSSDCARDRSFR
jgi:hypothetical protein